MPRALRVKPDFQTVLQRAKNGLNVKVPDLAAVVGMSTNGFYAATRCGNIRSVRVGRAVLIPGDEALRLLGAVAQTQETMMVKEEPPVAAPALPPITLTDEQFRQFLGAVCNTVRDAMRVQLGV